MIKNIYFLDRPTFNKDFYIRYEFEQLKKEGFNVKSLNLTRFVKGAKYEVALPEGLDDWVENFNSISEAKQFIRSHAKDSIIISLAPFCPMTAWVYRCIFKSNIPYLLLNSAVYPSFASVRRNQKQKLKSSLRRLTPSHLMRKPYNELLFIMAKLFQRNADGIIHSKANEGGKNKRLIGKETMQQYAVASDYKLAMEVSSTSPINEPYAVFIDQYFCHHLDFKSHQIVHNFTAKEYYSSLNRFLFDFKDKTGLKVVIASHPRRSTENKQDFNSQFELVYNKTAELVKHSDVVLQHFSTAISFSVIFNKPFLLLDSTLFADGTVGEKMKGFSEFFKKSCVSIDHPYEHKQKLLESDKIISEKYLNSFLKHPKATEYKTFNENVLSFIKSRKQA